MVTGRAIDREPRHADLVCDVDAAMSIQHQNAVFALLALAVNLWSIANERPPAGVEAFVYVLIGALSMTLFCALIPLGIQLKRRGRERHPYQIWTLVIALLAAFGNSYNRS